MRTIEKQCSILVVMTDCIFCKIVKEELPSEKVAQTDKLLVFKNLHPKTPIHLLIIPKTHYANMLEAPADIWQEVQTMIKDLAHKYKPKGFRISTNINNAALMQHMHIHFLAPVTKDREV